MKKRNCRRNEIERINHEKAVALRKMTDDQLVEYIDRQYRAGFDAGRIGNEIAEQEITDKFVKAITDIKGVGATTIAKIRVAFQEITVGERE